jgi:hypothetical protein
MPLWALVLACVGVDRIFSAKEALQYDEGFEPLKHRIRDC